MDNQKKSGVFAGVLVPLSFRPGWWLDARPKEVDTLITSLVTSRIKDLGPKFSWILWLPGKPSVPFFWLVLGVSS